MIGSATPDSLWAIQWWEALLPLGFALAVAAWAAVTSPRSREQRREARQRRRQRRSERALVRRQRAW